jgi:magnesium transporter
MLKKYKVCEGKLLENGTEECGVWVYVNPDEAEKRYLVDTLKVDEHTLNSALDPDELSRLEFEPDHLAIIFKRPRNYSAEDQFMFKVAAAGLFLFKERLIVVLADDTLLFGGKLFNKVSSLPDLMLRLIYRTIYHYLDHLKVINMITDSLEQKIQAAMENRYLLNLFSLEKSLVYYLNALHSNSMLIEKLKNNAAKIGFSPDNLEFIDDLLIENTQCLKQAEIYSNILASLMDARASIVSNNLNVLMKTLNIITICIMVPTLVVSIFSMNVTIPLAEHPLAFWMIMGLALVTAGGFMAFWRYKKWW